MLYLHEINNSFELMSPRFVVNSTNIFFSVQPCLKIGAIFRLNN